MSKKLILFLLCILFSGYSFAQFSKRLSSQHANEVVAAVLILEAGGEPLGGMEAVYEVIKNRAKSKNKSEYEIVKEKYQFSCFNKKSDEEIIIAAKYDLLKFPQKIWNKAILLVENKPETNITKGANHYHTKNIKPPYWAKGKTPIKKIGNHIFYKI